MDRIRATSISLLLASGVCLSAPAIGQEKPKDPMVLVETDALRIRARLSATFGAFGSLGTWFGLDTVTPGSTFDQRRGWAEGWLAPGLEVTIRPASRLEIYGSLTFGLSGTLGADAYDVRNQAAARPEAAAIGLRTTRPREELNLDLSVGRQSYGIGTGMLVWQGAGNGFERGALALLPRLAWENAAVARVTLGGWKAEAFHLDPDELRSANTGTRLTGGVLEYAWSEDTRIGGAYIRAIDSSAPYPLAASPFLIPDGRRGLESWHAYGRLNGSAVGLPQSWLRGEFALQRNDRIDLRASAWFAEVGHRFADLPFAPSLSYAYASFSGDNPRTARYERFDPLFYGNGIDNWWFGAASAYAFLNSNVSHHRAALQLTLTQRDFLKVQLIHSRANELFSPLQFGQLARPMAVNGNLSIVTGVADPHLSDEIYGEWTRLWSSKLASALWASYGRPGRGLRNLPGIQPENWFSAGAILSVTY